jgi:hypothetical protein
MSRSSGRDGRPEPDGATGQSAPLQILNDTGILERRPGAGGRLTVVESKCIAARLVLIDQVDVDDQRVVGVDGARRTECAEAAQRVATEVAAFDVGQMSKQIRPSANRRTGASSSTARTLCWIRSAASVSRVPATESAPRCSPAWGADRRPEAGGRGSGARATSNASPTMWVANMLRHWHVRTLRPAARRRRRPVRPARPRRLAELSDWPTPASPRRHRGLRWTPRTARRPARAPGAVSQGPGDGTGELRTRSRRPIGGSRPRRLRRPGGIGHRATQALRWRPSTDRRSRRTCRSASSAVGR